MVNSGRSAEGTDVEVCVRMMKKEKKNEVRRCIDDSQNNDRIFPLAMSFNVEQESYMVTIPYVPSL